MTKKLTGAISPLLILSIGLIIGISATFAYFQFRPKLTLQNQQTQSSPSRKANQSTDLSAETSVEADETANWKTYNDTDLNLSFRYPSGWQLKKCGSILLGPSQFAGECNSGDVPLILIKSTLDGSSPTACETKDLIKVKIGNYDAFKCVRVSVTDEASPPGTKYIHYLFNEQKTAIWYTQYPKTPNYETQFDQILSTFKFL